MKKETGCFDSYPAWIVLVTNLVSLSVYLAGLYLLYLIWPVLSLVFLLYILYMEFSLYREGCRHCWYFGKACAHGKGRIASVFFRKGKPEKFTDREFEAKDFIPHFMVALVPIAAGIYLLLGGLDVLIAALAVWPLIATFVGSPLIYGRLACPHCRQGDLGCPACDFFLKKSRKKKK
jgi:hypothetical protein